MQELLLYLSRKTKPPQSEGVIVVTLNLDSVTLHRGYSCLLANLVSRKMLAAMQQSGVEAA